jgi:hypothetical protein
MLEKTARNKHSSLLAPFLNYDENRVFRILLQTLKSLLSLVLYFKVKPGAYHLSGAA